MRPRSLTSADYAKAKKSNDTKLMIGFFLVVGSILGYFGYMSNRSVTTTMIASGKVADQFINDLSAGDVTSASSLLSAQARSINPPDTISGLITMEQNRHGKWLGADQTAFEQRNLYGIEVSKFGYKIKFENAIEPLHITLVRSYDGWQVDSFSFDG